MCEIAKDRAVHAPRTSTESAAELLNEVEQLVNKLEGLRKYPQVYVAVTGYVRWKSRIRAGSGLPLMNA